MCVCVSEGVHTHTHTVYYLRCAGELSDLAADGGCSSEGQKKGRGRDKRQEKTTRGVSIAHSQR